MPELYFKSPEHKQRWLQVMQESGRASVAGFDCEWGAALYILTTDEHLWRQAKGYMSPSVLDIEEMLNTFDLTAGTSVLIRLAGNLFNGNEHVDPLEFMRLDPSNFQVALAAIMIRRELWHLSDFETKKGK